MSRTIDLEGAGAGEVLRGVRQGSWPVGYGSARIQSL